MLQLLPSDKPIIVRIPDPPGDPTLNALSDVLVGSVGLTGAIVLVAVVLGLVLAGLMFWLRSRQA